MFQPPWMVLDESLKLLSLMCNPILSNETIQFPVELLNLVDHEDTDHLILFRMTSTTNHPAIKRKKII